MGDQEEDQCMDLAAAGADNPETTAPMAARSRCRRSTAGTGAGAADLGRLFANDRRANRLLTPLGLPHESAERAFLQLAERKSMRGGERRGLLLHFRSDLEAEQHVPAGAVPPHRLRHNTGAVVP